jgi:hypothetical protein
MKIIPIGRRYKQIIHKSKLFLWISISIGA